VIPGLNLARSNNELVLSWSGDALLQQASLLSGPWEDVGSVHPFRLTPALGQKFYRLRAQ